MTSKRKAEYNEACLLADTQAAMAELADALVLGASGLSVWVQVPLAALFALAIQNTSAIISIGSEQNHLSIYRI